MLPFQLLLATVLSSPVVWAAKPDKATDGKRSAQPQQEVHLKRPKDTSGHDWSEDSERDGSEYLREQARYFNQQHRIIVCDYCAGEFQRGRCPSGLAKNIMGVCRLDMQNSALSVTFSRAMRCITICLVMFYAKSVILLPAIVL